MRLPPGSLGCKRNGKDHSGEEDVRLLAAAEFLARSEPMRLPPDMSGEAQPLPLFIFPAAGASHGPLRGTRGASPRVRCGFPPARSAPAPPRREAAVYCGSSSTSAARPARCNSSLCPPVPCLDSISSMHEVKITSKWVKHSSRPADHSRAFPTLDKPQTKRV